MDKDAAINDSYYDKYYLKNVDEKTKNHISNHTFLKADQVYINLKNNGKSYVFSIFSDDGKFYTGNYSIDSKYLTATEK